MSPEQLLCTHDLLCYSESNLLAHRKRWLIPSILSLVYKISCMTDLLARSCRLPTQNRTCQCVGLPVKTSVRRQCATVHRQDNNSNNINNNNNTMHHSIGLCKAVCEQHFSAGFKEFESACQHMLTEYSGQHQVTALTSDGDSRSSRPTQQRETHTSSLHGQWTCRCNRDCQPGPMQVVYKSGCWDPDVSGSCSALADHSTPLVKITISVYEHAKQTAEASAGKVLKRRDRLAVSDCAKPHFTTHLRTSGSASHLQATPLPVAELHNCARGGRTDR